MHYHIAMASRDGMILNESRYEDCLVSIRDFVDIANKVYSPQKNPVVTEAAMAQYVDVDDKQEVVIYIDQGSSLRTYWIACTECKTLAIRN